MANGANRIFVSPGVYTSEKDLTFVSQSVGVTTLGLVGETIKGPAFEPIFINSYDEFTTLFGGLSPEKFVETQIPKYELPYIAKSYLSQSNQLFVTRVLGLSGYDAGPSWSITTVGSVSGSTVASTGSAGFTAQFATSGTNTSYIYTSTTFTTADEYFNALPATLYADIDKTINLLDSSTLPDIRTDVKTFFNDYIANGQFNTVFYWGVIPSGITNSITGAGYTLVSADNRLNSDGTNLNSDINDPWYYGLFDYDSTTSSFVGHSYILYVTTGGTSNLTPTTVDLTTSGASGTSIGVYSYTGCTGASGSFSSITYSNISGDNNIGYVTLDVDMSLSYPTTFVGVDPTFTFTSNCTFTGQQTSLYVTSAPTSISGACLTGFTTATTSFYTASCLNTVSYTGITSGSAITWTATPETTYHDLVVATLRSRGQSTLSSGGPVYNISADTGSNVVFNCSSSTYSSVLSNPFATFGINVTTDLGKSFLFEASMNSSSKNFISKVFGRAPFDKDAASTPLFVEEVYPNLLNQAYLKGGRAGLNCDFLSLPASRFNNSSLSSIGWYMEQYQTPRTPWVVSELRGTKTYRLFKFILISDGNGANREVKISVMNVSLANQEFDVVVRDFYDTDDNPIILEKYTRCSMDPQLNTYIAKKIGTCDGEYELKSSYVMLYMAEEHPTDAVASGFEGYIFRKYTGARNPFLMYKLKYDLAGDVIYNPPFTTTVSTDNNTISSGDKVRKVFLGISDTVGYDADFFEYKGHVTPADVCNDTSGNDWPILTKGFHLDSGATVVLGSPTSPLSGQSIYEVGEGDFTTEPDYGNPYDDIRARKFTFMPYGGFDGWDIYRKYRSNGDQFKLGMIGFRNGACSTNFASGTGDGSFKQISTVKANTDYYAYQDGILTYENPEAVNINVFATPGIDYVNNGQLVNDAIDMIENDRADSLYIVTTPDYNLLVPTSTDVTNRIEPDEAVDNIDNSDIDSNYTATYYPWIQIKDSENNVQVYLPSTGEVVKNIALTDNISFPWFATAGYNRGIVNAIKARKKLTLDNRDTLYKGRLNPIATFSDVGTVIFGNKTLQIRQSALDRINVRRLLLQARKLISAVAVRLLFEQNDQQVRNEFLDLVNPILDSIRRERGLTDFRVVVSNNPDDIDRNQLTAKIYLKPTRSLEFLIVDFIITPTGASFSE